MHPDITVDELKSRLLDTTSFYAECRKTAVETQEKNEPVSLRETRRKIDKILDVPTPRLSGSVPSTAASTQTGRTAPVVEGSCVQANFSSESDYVELNQWD